MGILARVSEIDHAKPKLACAPPDRMLPWLKLFCSGQDGMVQCRATNVARHSTTTRHTESLLYVADDFGLARMVRDARELSPRAEGVFFTINPVMSTVGSGSAADKHIRVRRWLLSDVDPIRPAGVSATDAEKAEAKKVIVAAAIWLGNLGWPNAIEADSGNGYHLLYRIDLPNNEAAATLIKRVLEAVASHVNTAFAKVDCSVYNASRMCKLYGTIARKGESTEERPHRVSSILDYPRTGLEVVTREQLEAVAGTLEVSPNPGTNGHTSGTNGRPHGIIARDLGDDPREAYCTKAFEEETHELATAQPGNRNNTLLKTAAALFELVGPGQLDQVEVEARLRETARQIGLETREIDRTIRSARDRARPRDLEHVGKKPIPEVVESPKGVKERVDDSHRLARIFLSQFHSSDDGYTLRFWNEEWHVWRRKAWQSVADKEVNAVLAQTIKEEFDRYAIEKGKRALGVGTRLIGNIALALRGMTLLTMDQIPQQPAWVGIEGPPPVECLPTQSGIVHLPTLVAGDLERAVISPTPRFFSPNVLSYGFDPQAPHPTPGSRSSSPSGPTIRNRSSA